MNYLKYLNYEQIITLKKYQCWFQDMPKHCDDTKSIFIHIPKAAGMSLVNSIYGLTSSNHDTWKEYYRRDSDKFSMYFKYAFVRNPLDRFISAYNYLAKDGKSDIDKYWNKKYIQPYGDVENFILKGGLKKAIKSVEHFKTQTLYVYKDGKLMVDYIGKYESIDKDIKVIKERLNLSFQLKEINKNPNKIADENTLSNNAKKQLSEFYKQDYLNFDYS